MSLATLRMRHASQFCLGCRQRQGVWLRITPMFAFALRGGDSKGGVMRQLALLAEALSKHPPLQTVCQSERPSLG